MDKDVLFLVDAASIELSEKDNIQSSWIHALPIGEYTHPVFGKLSMTAQKIAAFADSVRQGVRIIDPSINYMHGTAGAGDGEAAGWVKDAEVRTNGLWVLVEWTRTAAEKLKEKAFRYFSAEFMDKWTDAKGVEHSDVFLGGALTNRPYMKDLLPINLSEATVSMAVELAEAVAKGKENLANNPHNPQEGDVTEQELAKLLGLPEGTTKETLIAKLSELGAAKPQDDKPKQPEVPAVSLSEDLRKLSEDNPMVKTLLDTVDAQNKALHEFNTQLRESDVSRRLSEFDKSKIVLTPAAKDLVHDFAMDIPVVLSERFWEIMEKMRNSSSLMVELGERAGNSVRYGRAKEPVAAFMDMANAYAQSNKIDLSDAMTEIAKTDPKLYHEYRTASTSFRD